MEKTCNLLRSIFICNGHVFLFSLFLFSYLFSYHDYLIRTKYVLFSIIFSLIFINSFSLVSQPEDSQDFSSPYPPGLPTISTLWKELFWTDNIPLISSCPLINHAIFHGLKHILLDFVPFLIHIDSMDLTHDENDCDFLMLEKRFHGTTLLEVFTFLTSNKQTIPITVCIFIYLFRNLILLLFLWLIYFSFQKTLRMIFIQLLLGIFILKGLDLPHEIPSMSNIFCDSDFQIGFSLFNYYLFSFIFIYLFIYFELYLRLFHTVECCFKSNYRSSFSRFWRTCLFSLFRFPSFLCTTFYYEIELYSWRRSRNRNRS
jgi:hypothetical protein